MESLLLTNTSHQFQYSLSSMPY